ncbi:hypothetical protein BDW67DRAFT_166918 [Aspergillus spinulosporus]
MLTALAASPILPVHSTTPHSPQRLPVVEERYSKCLRVRCCIDDIIISLSFAAMLLLTSFPARGKIQEQEQGSSTRRRRCHYFR